MIPAEVIERKRDGATLAPGELRGFFDAYLSGDVADYQMAAFLMAVYFRGLDAEELRVLTRAMVTSGTRLDFGDDPAPAVDKHSTGGVGDTVSLILAPLVAAAGLRVPMMSGRGLGHTGGTLDKLESIPGFRTDPDLEEFRAIVADVGCAMTGPTGEIAPLDRRLYALRDVTATVPSIPLIASSIVSKKAAEGIGVLVLDVKVGRGAFMVEEARARRLAGTLVGAARDEGLAATALLTGMDHPLGPAVGNALEVREAVRCLRGEAGPAHRDLMEVTLALSEELLVAAESAPDRETARRRLTGLLEAGAAAERFARLVERQGGDPGIVDDPDRRLPRAPVRLEVPAPAAGWVRGMDAREVGRAGAQLGAGRTRIGEDVDPAVGVVLTARPGDRVEAGNPVATVHARSREAGEGAAGRLRAALSVADEPVEPPESRLRGRVPG